jgi:choline kinase
LEIKSVEQVDTAVILAAGRGSRMGTETDERPKCLVELGGRPLLEWQVGALNAAGISEISIVTGYRSEVLQESGLNALVNPEWNSSNMVVSLLYAKPVIVKPTIVSYSDIVYEQQAVEVLMAHPGDLVLAYDLNWLSVWNDRFEDPLSDAESFVIEDGVVKEIGKRCTDVSQISGQYMGLLKVSPTSMGWIEDLVSSRPQQRNSLDMTGLISELINEGRTVHGVPISGGWFEVDTASDLSSAQSYVSNKKLTLCAPQVPLFSKES